MRGCGRRLLTLLAARAISKRFGRTVALDRVDLSVLPGEIHALVGENGAGKSTLINIFAGRTRPDSGEVILDDVVVRTGSSSAALRIGIAAVYQSPMLFERMSWEENLALGGFGGARLLDLNEVAARASHLADVLGFRLPPPRTLIEERTIGERVRLEILRALSFSPRVLILDEPTGVLAPDELAGFLDLLRRLRSEGRIVLLVTHKLAEALAVADRVTVLRRGRVVAERLAAETDEGELARLMIGETISSGRVPIYYRAASNPVLIIKSLTLDRDGHPVLDGIDLTLQAGEITGIAGIDGNGQAELVEVLAGARDCGSGQVSMAATSGDGGGLAVIPQNRDLDGLILDMTLWENLLLSPMLRARCRGRWGWLQRALMMDDCSALIGRFQIRAAGPAAEAAALSGGNRQRLAVARALAATPRALIAHDICRGLDLRATADVHRMLREYAAAGGAVLLISSDLDELMTLCGRLAVLSRGRLTEIPPAERDATRIGLLMSGAAR